MHVPPPERKKGQVVAGRFRLVDQIGRGGMGSVWTAHHLTLKVDVAVKFMDGAFAVGDESMLKRFQKEATRPRRSRAHTSSRRSTTAKTKRVGRTSRWSSSRVKSSSSESSATGRFRSS